MQDDDGIDVERRLRTVLRPDEARARAVAARALSAERQRRSSWRIPVFAAAILVLAVIVASRSRRPADAPELVISGRGSVVVVTASDGRRWVINAESRSTPTGQYVIAFPR